jgi:hypothetical protein
MIPMIVMIFALVGTPSALAVCDDTSVVFDSGTNVGDEDCDGDGWTKGGDGTEETRDCDDELASVNPGQEVDRCDDSFDNNCDGYFNEGCEQAYQRGSLLGGSSCAVISSNIAWLYLLPLVGLRRRL